MKRMTTFLTDFWKSLVKSLLRTTSIISRAEWCGDTSSSLVMIRYKRCEKTPCSERRLIVRHVWGKCSDGGGETRSLAQLLGGSTICPIFVFPRIRAYLTPKHHGVALPEARVGLLSPVGHEPLEGGVFEEHEQDADEDPDDEQQVEPGVLLEHHLGRLALQLVVVVVVVALGAAEVEVLQVLDEPALVVLQQTVIQLALVSESD